MAIVPKDPDRPVVRDLGAQRPHLRVYAFRGGPVAGLLGAVLILGIGALLLSLGMVLLVAALGVGTVLATVIALKRSFGPKPQLPPPRSGAKQLGLDPRKEILPPPRDS